jgi:hypothetical protein
MLFIITKKFEDYFGKPEGKRLPRRHIFLGAYC